MRDFGASRCPRRGCGEGGVGGELPGIEHDQTIGSDAEHVVRPLPVQIRERGLQAGFGDAGQAGDRVGQDREIGVLAVLKNDQLSCTARVGRGKTQEEPKVEHGQDATANVNESEQERRTRGQRRRRSEGDDFAHLRRRERVPLLPDGKFDQLQLGRTLRLASPCFTDCGGAAAQNAVTFGGRPFSPALESALDGLQPGVNRLPIGTAHASMPPAAMRFASLAAVIPPVSGTISSSL